MKSLEKNRLLNCLSENFNIRNFGENDRRRKLVLLEDLIV
jgi:hypothetical protein